jgi:Protein of unknown function (DUF4031)
MAVYVDAARIPARVGRLTARWSHLTADTQPELHEFAERIGLRRAWFQTCKHNVACQPAERCPHWHYDVTDTKRALAIAAGAVPIDLRAMGQLIGARRTAMTTNAPSPRETPDHG